MWFKKACNHEDTALHIFCLDFESRLTKLSSDVDMLRKEVTGKHKSIDVQIKLILFLLGVCLAITFTDTVAGLLK